jgi:23S rRNA pseudouridine2605 synthase
MTHPSRELNKVYIAEIIGVPTREEIGHLKNGLMIDGYLTSPANFRMICSSDNRSVVEITIHEGRNRQVRKMCEKINHPVLKLSRIRIGELELGGLKPGEWRFLDYEEIRYIKSL